MKKVIFIVTLLCVGAGVYSQNLPPQPRVLTGQVGADSVGGMTNGAKSDTICTWSEYLALQNGRVINLLNVGDSTFWATQNYVRSLVDSLGEIAGTDSAIYATRRYVDSLSKSLPFIKSGTIYNRIALSGAAQSTFEDYSGEGIVFSYGLKDTLIHIYRRSLGTLGNHNDTASKVMARTSYNGGLTWTTPVIAHDSSGIDELSPTGGVVRNVAVVWSGRYKPTTPGGLSDTMVGIGYKYSLDAGLTWSAYIPYTTAFGTNRAASYGGFFRNRDTTYMSIYSGSANSEWVKTVDGKTWVSAGIRFTTTTGNCIEPNFVFTGTDSCIALLRQSTNANTSHYRITSTDGGFTWSSLQITNMNNGVNAVNNAAQLYDTENGMLFTVFMNRPVGRPRKGGCFLQVYANTVSEVFNSATSYRLISKNPSIYPNNIQAYGYASIAKYGTKKYLGMYTETFLDRQNTAPLIARDFQEGGNNYQFDVTIIDSINLGRASTRYENQISRYNTITGIMEMKRVDDFQAWKYAPEQSITENATDGIFRFVANPWLATDGNDTFGVFADVNGLLLVAITRFGDLQVNRNLTINGLSKVKLFTVLDSVNRNNYRIFNDGSHRFGSAGAGALLTPLGSGTTPDITGTNLGAIFSNSAPTRYSGNGAWSISTSIVPAHTSNTSVLSAIISGFAPTSGTGSFTYHSITGTINQTGGASGIVRGLHINNVVTAAADYRAIEVGTGSVFLPSGTNGSLVVGASSVTPSAKLAVTSTTQGFLPPRMTSAQGSAISSPAEGLIIYVTDTNLTFITKGWWGYNGTTWQQF